MRKFNFDPQNPEIEDVVTYLLVSFLIFIYSVHRSDMQPVGSVVSELNA